MEQFDAIRQGIDPATGQFLRQRHGTDRLSEMRESSDPESVYPKPTVTKGNAN